MLGPSRCGKTTLLASIINEFMELSEEVSKKDDEYIKLKPVGETRGRINKSIDAIKVSTRDGEFVRAGLEGTQDHTVFNLDMAYQKKSVLNSDPDFSLHFHDFPGGWIAQDHPGLKDVQFDKAQILLMPVDASLIFEASRPKQKASVAMQLELESLKNVAKAWANARKNDKGHPGLFVLAPVKCETYFNDNLPVGLKRDCSKDLKKKVGGYFAELVTALHDISPQISAWYMPVDTIGCCFINQKEWVPSEAYGEELKAQFKIPTGLSWTPFGPAQVMLKILEYLINDNEANKGMLDRLLTWVGWNTDLGKKLKTMQNACDQKYKRDRKLW